MKEEKLINYEGKENGRKGLIVNYSDKKQKIMCLNESRTAGQERRKKRKGKKVQKKYRDKKQKRMGLNERRTVDKKKTKKKERKQRLENGKRQEAKIMG